MATLVASSSTTDNKQSIECQLDNLLEWELVLTRAKSLYPLMRVLSLVDVTAPEKLEIILHDFLDSELQKQFGSKILSPREMCLYAISFWETDPKRYFWFTALVISRLGLAYAHHQLGWCFQNKIGITVNVGIEFNKQMAIKHYTESANVGVSATFNNLGWCIMEGWDDGGVKISETILQKAQHENPEAQSDYAYFCFRKKNYAEAFKLFSLAAQKGDALSQNYLGHMYYCAKGVLKDEKLALEWWNKSEQQNNDDAAYNLGIFYREGPEIKRDYTKSMEMFTKAAKQGHSSAMYEMGKMGLADKSLSTEAIIWLKKAKNNGHEDAKTLLKTLPQEEVAKIDVKSEIDPKNQKAAPFFDSYLDYKVTTRFSILEILFAADHTLERLVLTFVSTMPKEQQTQLQLLTLIAAGVQSIDTLPCGLFGFGSSLNFLFELKSK